jgi:hypothetical protein
MRCIYFSWLMLLFACTPVTKESSVHQQLLPDSLHTITIDYQITGSGKTGYGYIIFINGKKTIVQPHIPGSTGNKGFDSPEKATMTAGFIVDKLRKNNWPPTISAYELDSLGVWK